MNNLKQLFTVVTGSLTIIVLWLTFVLLVLGLKVYVVLLVLQHFGLI